jgi:hypothetical protein
MNQRSGVDTSMLQRAQGLMDKFTGMTPAPNVFRVATGPEIEANANQAFPVQLGSTDPDDEKYALRAKVIETGNAGTGVVPGVGQVIADEKFFDYAKRKKDQEVLYDFYRFMMSNADLSKPESAQWWFGKFPWMRDLRLAEINKQCELQKALARIQVTGPDSEDDFMLLFLIRNGTIVPPAVPVTKLGTAQATGIADTFQKGFFSPFSRGNWMKTPTEFADQPPNMKVPFRSPLDPGQYQQATVTSILQPANWKSLLGIQTADIPARGAIAEIPVFKRPAGAFFPEV